MPKPARLAFVLLSLCMLQTGFGQGPSFSYTTLAGVGTGAGTKDGTGGMATSTLFNFPIGSVLDSNGNLFVADSGSSVIRKIAPDGTVSTFAGSPLQAGHADGAGSHAYFNSPQSPVMDSSGNIYVVEYGNHDIRKITPAGVVTTFAGVATVRGHLDATGTSAYFNQPRGLAIDGSGNLYVADTSNHVIRKITPAGVVTTLAGKAGTSGSADGTGTAATFNNPIGIAVDSSGDVYVGDTGNSTIRKVTSAGVVTTLAGTNGTAGFADGTGTAAQFNYPVSIAINSSGNLIVADYNNSVLRQVTPAGAVTTIVGTGLQHGRVDATGAAARFDHPSGVRLDSSGNIFVTDYISSLVRKVSSSGEVTTLAGAGGARGYRDGTGTITSPGLFNQPWSVTVDAAGNAYVADTSNHVIKKVTPAGVVTTFAGTLGFVGTTDGGVGTGRFRYPESIVWSSTTGKFYVADSGNHTVRVVAADGTVSTLAGQAGVSGTTDGTGTAALFNGPTGVTLDGSGNIFVADTTNNEIRRVTPDGVVTTFVGQTTAGTSDGAGTSAQFSSPHGLAVDAAGNLFVADTGNHTIRKVTPDGTVSTFAGIAGTIGADDGPVASATFYNPTALAFDSAGNLYVADRGNNVIRLITPGGTVTTVGGQIGASGSLDGTGDNARFNGPNGIAIDGAGNLYVADTFNSTLRKGTLLSSSGGTGSGVQTYRSTTAPTGDLSIGDLWYKTDTSGQVTAVYRWNGSQWIDITGDTSGSGTSFLLHPVGLALDLSGGNLYVADTGNHAIKKIVISSGEISTFAGTVGTSGSADGTGTAATFNSPKGVAWDGTNSILYVADTGNATIRKITAAGVVTTLAGSPANHGYQDGTGSDAYFSVPVGLSVDSGGNLFVTDAGSATIRYVTTAGVVTTYAGKAQYAGDANGTGSAARFTYPTGLSIDGSGNLFVADTYSNTIRGISAGAVVGTKAGVAGLSGFYDGVATNAFLNLPRGVAYYGTDGSVFVADTANHTIRRINSNNVVSTVAGVAGVSGSRDSADGTPLFNQPQGIAVDGSANLYVADTGNSTIRKIAFDGTVTTLSLKAPSSGGGGGGGGSGGGGGGGAPSGWFLGGLAAISLLRWLKRKT
jgi:DNA-binding beta-propeller fold protein YncE